MKLLSSLKTWIFGILTKSLPDRQKRLILLASVAARVVNKTQFEKTAISKLNTTLHLCTPRKEGGLQIPMMLSRVLWRDQNGEEVLFDAEQDIAPEQEAVRILTAAPSWMRYEGDMQGDIQLLLSNKEMLVTS